jgi:hypothetical protein
MGTRTLVHIKDGRKTIATIYRQYDGYPSGIGEDIKRILNGGEVEVLNGYNGSTKVPAQFNGIGCLAAFLIGELKERKIGNVYLMAANSKDCGEDFTYTLSMKGKNLCLKVEVVWNKEILFDGPLSQFCGQKAEGKTQLEVELS